MKRIILLIAAVATLVGCNSTKCEIVGRIDNFSAEGKVYLTDTWKAHAIVDSAMIVDNSFRFKSVKHVPTFARLILEGGRPVAVLFVEKGKVDDATNILLVVRHIGIELLVMVAGEIKLAVVLIDELNRLAHTLGGET